MDGEHAGEGLIQMERTILDNKGIQGILSVGHLSPGCTQETGEWIPIETVQGSDTGEPVEGFGATQRKLGCQ